MTLRSLNPAVILFISMLLLVVGVSLAGSYYYKQMPQSAPAVVNTSTDSSEPITTEEENEIVGTANLQLIPTNAERTSYRVVISDISQPITGLAFQLMSSPDGAQIVSNRIEVNSELPNSGWETAINSSTNSDSSQELSFSMIYTSPGNYMQITSLEIGTLSFDRTPTESDLILNQEESMVTYTENKIAPLTLVLETDTMSN